jgi:hypothetical protein
MRKAGLQTHCADTEIDPVIDEDPDTDGETDEEGLGSTRGAT